MPLPMDFLQRLKAANPIEEVIGSYVTLKRAARDYVCLCPFHSEKTPSFHVHPDKEYFYCFGCHAGGDVITFVMKYNNLDYLEAVKFLAQRGGIPFTEDLSYDKKQSDERKKIYQINKTAARFFYSQLKTPEGAKCLNYLINVRKLSIATIKKYGMGFAPNSWSSLKNYMLGEGYSEEDLEKASLISRSKRNPKNTFDFFVNRAMFPFIDLMGNIVGFGGRALSDEDSRKYLNSKDTICYSKNKFLFSMNFAKNQAVKNRTILLCEGNLDVISLNQAGFENAVASCGTALTEQQAKIISNYADKVIICYDADEAGQNATERAINILSSTGLDISVIKMKGAKDPDEYIKKFGADHFRNLLTNSKLAIEFEIDKYAGQFDLSNPDEKFRFLNKIYNVLAQIKSDDKREIYIRDIFKKYDIYENYGVTVDAIQEKVNSILKTEERKAARTEWINTASFKNRPKDEINPEANEHKKQADAECGIIYYIMVNPDSLDEISRKISPDDFVTAFNKKVYESLTNKIKNLEDFSISSFVGEFSPDEVGKITEIIDKNDKLAIDSAVVNDYISVLIEYKENKDTNASTFSDDEFIKNLERLRNKKKK